MLKVASSLHSIYQCTSHPSQTDRPLIMGILNLTPDSFFDGGQLSSPLHAVSRAKKMIDAGADIIDIGGESTGPGAAEVSENEEIDRVIPVLQQLKKLNIPMSIDTSKAAVMRTAVDAGASMINDVRALREKNALATAAELQVPVCLMHMQGKPRSMQNQPNYQNVVQDVLEFLQQRVKACENAGISKQLLSIDPGFGFGKALPHNLEMLNHLDKFGALGLPVLVGLSRKSMLGEITGKTVDRRLASSLAVALIAMQKGARIIRVHDIAEACDIRQVYMALKAL